MSLFGGRTQPRQLVPPTVRTLPISLRSHSICSLGKFPAKVSADKRSMPTNEPTHSAGISARSVWVREHWQLYTHFVQFTQRNELFCMFFVIESISAQSCWCLTIGRLFQAECAMKKYCMHCSIAYNVPSLAVVYEYNHVKNVALSVLEWDFSKEID